MKLKTIIAEWMLVRALNSAILVLNRIERLEGMRPPMHVLIMREVCSALFDQIRTLQKPIVIRKGKE